jgi:hypothetical protein
MWPVLVLGGKGEIITRPDKACDSRNFWAIYVDNEWVKSKGGVKPCLRTHCCCTVATNSSIKLEDWDEILPDLNSASRWNGQSTIIPEKPLRLKKYFKSSQLIRFVQIGGEEGERKIFHQQNIIKTIIIIGGFSFFLTLFWIILHQQSWQLG